MLDVDRAVGIEIYPSARLGFFDLAAGSARHTGRVPADDPYPFNILHMAYFAFLAVHPEHERFAVLPRQGSRIEFHDGAGEPVAETDGPNPFPVDYEVDRGGHMVRGLRNRHGYRGAATTRDRLYALFSGRAEAHFPGERGQAAEFVHVFDWDGRLQLVCRLDREVTAIALDPAAGTLYAVASWPAPAVLSFPQEYPGGPPLSAETDADAHDGARRRGEGSEPDPRAVLRDYLAFGIEPAAMMNTAIAVIAVVCRPVTTEGLRATETNRGANTRAASAPVHTAPWWARTRRVPRPLCLPLSFPP